MLDDERQLIQRLTTLERRAKEEFAYQWRERVRYWVSQHCRPGKVHDYSQEVWAHLSAGRWLRLLQWRPLYDDSAWSAHSFESFLKRITINKVRDLVAAEPPALPEGLDPNDIIDRTTPVGWDPAFEVERARLIEAYEFCSEFFRPEDHFALALWFEGHDARFIAEKIDSNPNNVYQRRSYLFKRLRDCLTDQLPEYFDHV